MATGAGGGGSPFPKGGTLEPDVPDEQALHASTTARHCGGCLNINSRKPIERSISRLLLQILRHERIVTKKRARAQRSRDTQTGKCRDANAGPAQGALPEIREVFNLRESVPARSQPSWRRRHKPRSSTRSVAQCCSPPGSSAWTPPGVALLTKQKQLARSQALIAAIVRQTTVLIAQLSTAAGVRSPLGHVVDEVFSGLVSELNQQGVSNKVIADMFGMALRSYRQKVRRLGESATSRGATLWSAVQEFLAEREWSTREEVLARFKHDDEVSVRSILNDLVETGLAVRSGLRHEVRYRIATEEELRDSGTEPGHGEAAGWEAAIVEHHRAVLNSIATTATCGRRAAQNGETGATTLRFDVWPGHPKEREIRQLLAQTRAAALQLWAEANESCEHGSHPGAYQVHFYVGQYLVADDELP
jgi:hypothetical protein